MFQGSRILVAPLDWGLGHAARCVPVVRALQELDAVPVLGADKGPLALLREEFPKLEHVCLPGLEIRYGEGRNQSWALARQVPAWLRQADKEHRMFLRVLPGLRLRAVISDQRFGIRAPDLPSVLITHQVFPFTPFAQGLARRINRRHIRRFQRCWIPDQAEAPGLAGDLSHGKGLPENARYIGPLSRFRDSTPAESKEHHWHTVTVISGPEPQRSLFENAVRAQLSRIDAGLHLILPGKVDVKTQRLPQLPTPDVHAALLDAELIISRSGYSTLMDLEAIGRGALLVPTPGQSEQEYLARLHGRQGHHMVQDQHGLDIGAAFQQPPGRRPSRKKDEALQRAMSELAQWIAPPRIA
jgi:hypothetical protein